MKKIITLLLSLVVAFGLASCDNSKSSSVSSNAVESSSSVSSASSSSTAPVQKYSVTLNTGVYVTFEQVSDLDLSELETGDVVKFKVSLAPETKGTLVITINGTTLTPDSSSVYSYTVEDKNLVLEASGISFLADNALVFTSTDAARFVGVDEDELPKVVQEGSSVSFKLEVQDMTTGTAVVKAGDVVLTADEAGVYTYLLEDKDVTFTVEDVRLLENFTVTAGDTERYTLTDKDGAALPATVLEGESVDFKVAVKDGYSPLEKVMVGDTELVASEDGVYTYTPEADFTVDVTGVKKEVMVKEVVASNLMVNYSEDYSDLLEGETVMFMVDSASFATVENLVVKVRDVVLTANEDGYYSVVAGTEDVVITVEGNSVADASSVVLAGDGSEEAPFEVGSALELIAFSSQYATDHAEAADYDAPTYVMLTSDIDMESYALSPINGFYGFFGNFDGNGKVISNFNVDGTTGRAGLFYLTNSSMVYNFTIEANIDVSDVSVDAVGAVAATSYATEYYGIVVTGTIIGDAYGMGGLVGIDFTYAEDGQVIYEGNDVNANIMNYSNSGFTAGLIGIADNSPFSGTDGVQLLAKNNKVSGMVAGYYFVAGLTTSIAANSTVTGNYIDTTLYSMGTGEHVIAGIVGWDAETSASANRFLINNVFAGEVAFESADELYVGIGSIFATVVNKDTYFLDTISVAALAVDGETSATAEEIAGNVMGLDPAAWNVTTSGVTLKGYAAYHEAYAIKDYEALFTYTDVEQGEFDSTVISQLNPSYLTLPTPEKEGLVFEGWYLDKALTVPYEGAMVLIQDTTLYAKWSVAEEMMYVGDYTVLLSEDEMAYISLGSDGNVLYYVPGKMVAQLLPVESESGLSFSDGYTTLNLNVSDDDKLSLTVGEEDVMLVMVTDDSFPVIDGALFVETFAGNYEYFDPDYQFTFSLTITAATESEEGSIYLNDFGGDETVASGITVANGMFTFVGENATFDFVYTGAGFHVIETSDMYGQFISEFTLAAPEEAPVAEDYYAIYAASNEDTVFADNVIELADVVLVNGEEDPNTTFEANEDGDFVLTYMGNTYVVTMSYGYVMFGDIDVDQIEFTSISDYEGVYLVTNVDSSKESYLIVDETGNVTWNSETVLAETDYFGDLMFTMNDVEYALIMVDYDVFEFGENVETPVNTYDVVMFEQATLADYAGFYRDATNGQMSITEDEVHYMSYESYDLSLELDRLVATTLDGDVLTFVMTEGGLEMTGVMADGTTEIASVSFNKTETYTQDLFLGLTKLDGKLLYGYADENGDVQISLDGVAGTFEIVNNEVTATFGSDVLKAANTAEGGDAFITFNGTEVSSILPGDEDYSSLDGMYKDVDNELFVTFDSYYDEIMVDGEAYSFVMFGEVSYLYYMDMDGMLIFDYSVTLTDGMLTLTSMDNEPMVLEFMSYTDTSSIAGTYYADVNNDEVIDEVVINEFGDYLVLDKVGVVTLMDYFYYVDIKLALDGTTYTVTTMPETGQLVLSATDVEDMYLGTFATMVVGKSYVATVDGVDLRFEFGYSAPDEAMYVVADGVMLLLINEGHYEGSAEYNGVSYYFTLDMDGNLEVIRMSDGTSEDTVVVSLDLNQEMQDELLAPTMD